MKQILKQLEGIELANQDQVVTLLKEAKLTEEQVASACAALKLVQGLKAVVAVESMEQVSKMLVPQAEKPAAPVVVQTKAELIEELRKEGFKVEEPVEEEPMDKEVQAQLEAIRKEFDGKLVSATEENKTLKADLAKERDMRLTREFEAKAQSMGYAGERAIKVAKSLKTAHDKMSAEEYAEIETLAKATIDAEKASPLFKELGTGQTPADGKATLEAEIETAKAALSKEHPKWSKEKVAAEVYSANPKFYEAHSGGEQ